MAEKQLDPPKYHFNVNWIELRPWGRKPDGSPMLRRCLVGEVHTHDDEAEAITERNWFRFHTEWVKEKNGSEPEVGPLIKTYQVTKGPPERWERETLIDPNDVVSDEQALENLARLKEMLAKHHGPKKLYTPRKEEPRQKCDLCGVIIIREAKVTKDGKSHQFCEAEKSAGRDPRFVK